MQTSRITHVRSTLLSFTSLIMLSSLAGGLSGLEPAMALEGSSRTMVSQPDSGVALTVDLNGFTIDRDQLKPNGRRYVTASQPATGINVAIALEQVTGRASIGGCIEQLRQLKKGPAVRRGIDVSLSASRDMPTLEYTIPRFQGLRLDQKSLYACMAEANVYATIHVSKIQYTHADASRFQRLLTTMRLQPGHLARATAHQPQTTAQPFFVETVRYEPQHETGTMAP